MPEPSIQEGPEHSEDLAALERFVLESDDLLALEERIGRFNIFDALGIARRELQHSNFLAWLLDPAESHGQGDLFLRAVLMDMMRSAREQGIEPPVSPVVLDGDELGGVGVRREWKNLDLVIEVSHPRFVVAIENKVDSGEHSDQLARYEAAVQREFPGRSHLFVFLTPEGAAASCERWVCYSYADLLRVLERTRTRNSGTIGGDVAVLVDHYITLVGSRFMEQQDIKQLCRRIYTAHRQAIELIVSHAADTRGMMIESLAAAVQHPPLNWMVPQVYKTACNCCPADWPQLLPAIYARPDDGTLPWEWLVWTIAIEDDSVKLILYVGATSDQETKRRYVDALVREGRPEGFRFVDKGAGKHWRRLWSVRLSEKDVGEHDASEIVEDAIAKMVSLRPLLDRVSSTIRALALGKVGGSDGRLPGVSP